MAKVIEEGKLGTLSVKELKSFLYYRDATLSGPKRDLVSRIEEVWQQEQAVQNPAGAPQPQASPGPSTTSPARPAALTNGAAAGSALFGSGGAELLGERLLGEGSPSQNENALVGEGEMQTGPHDDFMIDEVFSAM